MSLANITFIISYLAYMECGHPALQIILSFAYSYLGKSYRRKPLMKKWILISAAFIFLLGACSFIGQPNISSNAPMNNGYGVEQSGGFASNGQQVYFTATDQDGQRISYTGGPAFGDMMMGSYYTCASCHGNDGHGGTHTMHMQVMDAPAINYSALIEMKKKDSGGNPTDYSIADLRGAVVDGNDTGGNQLGQNMPRWQMSDQDLADLLQFLKTLP